MASSADMDESKEISVSTTADGQDEGRFVYDPEKHMVDGQPYIAGLKLGLLILGLCLGNFLVALDITIVATAIPEIVTAFHSLKDVGWYGASYLLTLTAFQPPWGKIFKYFDVKWTYLAIVFIFEVGSLICAISPNSATFIVGRAVAGLGAAGLYQGSLNIIGLSVPLSKRPLYFSVAISVFGIASGFGPILGGALTDKASWRWCFWINLPVGGFAALVTFIFVSAPRRSSNEKKVRAKLQEMDFPGTTVLICSLTCLFLALELGGNSRPWSSQQVIGLFVGFGILLFWFMYWQWKQKELATIPLHILRQRTILGGVIFVFMSHVALQVHTYYIPFYFQSVQNVSAVQSGIRNIPLVMMVSVGSIISGALIMLFGHYMQLMYLGSGLYVAGSALIQTFTVGTGLGSWVGYQVLAGGAIGLCFQIPFTALQLVLDEDDKPTGNAIMVFFLQLGGAIATSIAQSIFTSGLRNSLHKHIALPVDAIIDIGPTQIESISTDPVVTGSVIESYAEALRSTFLFATIGAGVALLACTLMEFKTIKSPSKEIGSDVEKTDPVAI